MSIDSRIRIVSKDVIESKEYSGHCPHPMQIDDIKDRRHNRTQRNHHTISKGGYGAELQGCRNKGDEYRLFLTRSRAGTEQNPRSPERILKVPEEEYLVADTFY